MFRYCTRLLVLLVLCYCASGVAPGSIIVQRLGGAAGALDAYTISADEAVAVSWDQPVAIYDWAVTAFGLKNTLFGENVAVNFALKLNAPDAVTSEYTGQVMVPGATGDQVIVTTPNGPVTTGTIPGFVPGQVLFGSTSFLAPGVYFLVASAGDLLDRDTTSWVRGLGRGTEGVGVFGPEAQFSGDAWNVVGFPAPGEGDPFLGVGFEVTGSVPEPATFLLVGAALAAVGYSRRRRRA